LTGVVNEEISVLRKVGMQGKTQQTHFVASIIHAIGDIKKRIWG
jgi:hypothetical protein